MELDVNYARDTLVNLERIWNRPVHIETVLDDKKAMLSFDGDEHDLDWGEDWEFDSEQQD